MGEDKQLIGSIVRVRPPFINDKTNNKDPVVGSLDFIGPNNYLGWELQVTIDRTPYQIKSLSQIELVS